LPAVQDVQRSGPESLSLHATQGRVRTAARWVPCCERQAARFAESLSPLTWACVLAMAFATHAHESGVDARHGMVFLRSREHGTRHPAGRIGPPRLRGVCIAPDVGVGYIRAAAGPVCPV